jgi:hypothetical protein
MKMKRIVTAAAVLFTTTGLHAQPAYDPFHDSYFINELNKNITILIFFAIIGIFVIAFMRVTFDHRLKAKMIEKGVSENLAAQFLRSNTRNMKNEAIKWFCIFTGLGTGLLIVNLFQPYGLHSLAILSFSIAAGFLGYYLFSRRSEKAE